MTTRISAAADDDLPADGQVNQAREYHGRAAHA